jgi:CRISPR-associated endonuclease Cas1
LTATDLNKGHARRREQARDRRLPKPPLRRRGEVCVAAGYGVRIRIDGGRLVVSDGIGRDRRERRYSRVTSQLSRLVVLGHAGYMTLEASSWLADLGIPFMHFDADGRLLACSATGTADARLRRMQALAFSNEVGLGIARFLLGRKLAGQRALLSRLGVGPWLTDSFDGAAALLETAATLNELVMAERDAALAYWHAWANVETQFRPVDRQRVPEQWLTFMQRGSPLTSSSRLAVNPANAILNYLYALLEAETTIACHAVGLDPTLGIVHADYKSRDSLALDLMETVRPDVDAYALDLFDGHIFAPSDFHETRRGACRLLPPLTHRLAETALTWAQLIAPVAEQVAAKLAKAPGSRIDRLPTPLTGMNRLTGREAMRRSSRRPAVQSRLLPRCGLSAIRAFA